jgi:hypothetical protein
MSLIIDITNILSEKNATVKWVKKELSKLQHNQSKIDKDGQIAALIQWLNEGKNIIDLVKIIMCIVNPLNIPGKQKKKEAEFLYIRILELVDTKNDINDYIDLFDSFVETIIWARNGGLKKIRKNKCFLI